MKVVLIQPKAYKHAPDWVNEPLNLGYLASYLRINGYKDVSIIIGAWETDDKIVLEASQADIVGITATSPMMTHGRELARLIKKSNPSVPIVFGGAHPTSLPESTLSDVHIDIVARGEGEATFLDIVKSVEHKTPRESILGISFRKNGEICHNPFRPLIEDIDQIPFPARDLMKQKKFSELHCMGTGKRTANLFSSRGCPFQCTYCASHTIWTRKFRMRSPKNIIDEIEELVTDYKIKRINFHDDTFTVNRKRVFRFCDELKKRKLGVIWGCNVHVNTVDEELLTKMKEAGCIEVWVGVESGSQIILDELKKDSNINKIKETFRISKKLGLKRHAYLMVGSLSESRDTIRETKDLIKEIDPDYAAVTIFTPYPGCEAYDYAKAHDFVKDDIDWSVVDLHFSVTMPTKNLSQNELADEHSIFSAELEGRRRKSVRFRRLRRIWLALKTTPAKGYPQLMIRYGGKFIRLFKSNKSVIRKET